MKIRVLVIFPVSVVVYIMLDKLILFHRGVSRFFKGSILGRLRHSRIIFGDLYLNSTVDI